MTAETLFFRLVGEEDKGAALADALACVRGGDTLPHAVFEADPASFRYVPTAPFAYWVSDRLRHKFVELPAFESDGRSVRVGLQTSDDFRFLRTTWEVPAAHVLGSRSILLTNVEEFQTRCRQRTFRGAIWVPFAKGGEYSPFYADVHLLVNWRRDGTEIKAWAGSLYNNSHWSRIIKNVDYTFRPGMTWPRRTQGGFGVRTFPAGCAFADKGPVAFTTADQLHVLLGLTNSDLFFQLISLQMSFGAYETGVIQRTPVPAHLQTGRGERMAELALRCVELKRGLDSTDETSHAMVLPALLRMQGSSIVLRLRSWQVQLGEIERILAEAQQGIDALALEMYDIADQDRQVIEQSRNDSDLGTPSDEGPVTDEEATASEADEADLFDRRVLASALLSYMLGVAFGRWDARIALDPSLARSLSAELEG